MIIKIDELRPLIVSYNNKEISIGKFCEEIDSLATEYAEAKTEALRKEVEELKKERDGMGEDLKIHTQDLQDAAGELMVSLPKPGTEAAKMLRANRLIRKERDEALREVGELQSQLNAAREENERLRKQLLKK
jgi:HAMP domain-containing protein